MLRRPMILLSLLALVGIAAGIALLALAWLPLRSAPPSTPRERTPTMVMGGSTDGRQLYQQICANCHSSKTDIAPPLIPALWQPRLAQGRPMLYRHAIEGKRGADGRFMPPRGGNPYLTDEQVRATVDWMVDQLGSSTESTQQGAN